MTKTWAVLVLLALALSGVALSATTQDFNDYGASTGLGFGQAENLGFFTLAFPGFTLVAGGSTGLQLDAPQYFGAVNYELLSNGGDLTIDFATTQNAFSIDLRDFSGFGGIDTVTVYGADDVTVLNTYSVALDGTIITFSDPGENAPIGAVNLSVISGENWSGILQSVTYDITATPEPGSFALLGAGLLGLAGLARRKLHA
jgi:hypothetical protein